MTYKLIKYVASKEYAECFLSGKLYMNTIGFFINNGFEDQKDAFEGTFCTVENSKFPILPQVVRSMQASDLTFRAVGYQYCNVLCFFKVGVTEENGLCTLHYNPKMKKFGEYVIIVKNETELINRIGRAVKKLGYKYICSKVKYHTPKKDGELIRDGHVVEFTTDFEIQFNKIPKEAVSREYDCFDKTSNMSSQNEWRVALYRGEKTIDAFVLDVGDLHDICIAVKSENLVEGMKSAYGKDTPVYLQEGYFGNINKKDFRMLFYELGDHKGTMLMRI